MEVHIHVKPSRGINPSVEYLEGGEKIKTQGAKTRSHPKKKSDDFEKTPQWSVESKDNLSSLTGIPNSRIQSTKLGTGTRGVVL